MNIPVLDYSDVEKLREELAAHPLYIRRQEVLEAFLADLTQLTRRYGLAIDPDTRTEYGEIYADCAFEIPRQGTEGRYVLSDYKGLEFASAEAEKTIPCSPEERATFEQAKRDRQEESAAIDALSRQINKAHWAAWEKSRNEQWSRYAEQMRARPEKQTWICGCRQKFSSKSALQKHVDKTGHAASL